MPKKASPLKKLGHRRKHHAPGSKKRYAMVDREQTYEWNSQIYDQDRQKFLRKNIVSLQDEVIVDDPEVLLENRREYAEISYMDESSVDSDDINCKYLETGLGECGEERKESDVCDDQEGCEELDELEDSNEEEDCEGSGGGDEIQLGETKKSEYFIQLRKSICSFYEVNHKCAPESTWMGEDGVIAQLRKTFKLPRYACYMIKRALKDYNECKKNGKDYNGQRRTWNWNDNDIILPEKSHEVQIIGNAMESGHRICATTALVNMFR